MQPMLALLPSLMRQSGRMLRFIFLPNFARSLRPVGESYYNFGRMLTGVFASIGVVERTHPWRRAGANPRPLEVLSYACAKADWKRPLAMPTVMTAAITLLVSTGFLALVGMSVNVSVGAGQAYAQSLFSATSPSTDLALRYMSNSFGITIPGVPASAVDGIVSGFQRMMGIYSTAMLIIAGFILLYILLGVIASTAHEGRFGGSGFNQVWAPIRLVVAIGLLVPISNSYNSGQYIVMKISEWGSGLATNLWVPFATALASRGPVVATPGVSPAAASVAAVLTSEFCMDRYNRLSALAGPGTMEPMVIVPSTTNAATNYFYTAPRTDMNGPFCGSISYMLASSISGNPIVQAISTGFETAFFNMRDQVRVLAQSLNTDGDTCGANCYINLSMDTPSAGSDNLKAYFTNEYQRIIVNYQNQLASVISGAMPATASAASTAITTAVTNSGWAGAAVWFNTIARLNAEVMAAARGMPSGTAPMLNNAFDARDAGIPPNSPADYVNRGLKSLEMLIQTANTSFGMSATAGMSVATAASPVYTPYVTAGLSETATTSGRFSGWIGERINTLLTQTFVGGPFGSIGSGANASLSQINPLAQLAAIGSWLIDRTIALLGIGILGSAVIPVGISFLIFGLAAMGFSAGVLLFYVTPLMPFIRMLFGVVGWLINILEAVIAIPLVAIAHLSTRGEGISGDMARTAYFMVLSIFLRPALLIVGMVAALMMFTVAIGVLNDQYRTAVEGYLGNTPGGANGGLSIIMFTVMYAALAFGCCNLCFKLIEEIPNRALSWINQAAARPVTEDEMVSKALTGTGEGFIGIGSRFSGRGASGGGGAAGARLLRAGGGARR